MKFGLRTKERFKTVAHDHVPGRAFEIEDPVQRLIHMVGGGFFNEQDFYGGDKGTDLELTGKAQELVATAQAVAKSDKPEDLLIIARWARDHKSGLRLRTVSQLLLAVAAGEIPSRCFVQKYTPLICQRADDIRQAFQAYRVLYSKEGKSGRRTGSVPHSFRKGLAAAFRNFGEYDFLKYDGSGCSFRDVLLMIGGSSKVKNPVSKGIYKYLVNGDIPDAQETPMLAKRQSILIATKLADITAQDAEEAGLTWENVISQFGSSKESWEFSIPMMGEMALLRNLRNFEENKISPAHWDLVYDRMKAASARSSILPFRYYTAYLNSNSSEAHSTLGVALDNSIQTLPELQGISAILADNSGSCNSNTVSASSDMRVSDVGNMLMAVMAKRFGRKTQIGVFGDAFSWVPFSETDSTMGIKKTIDEYAQTKKRDSSYLGLPHFVSNDIASGVGLSTETGLWFGLQNLIDRKEKVDRIILLSDLCCYTQGDENCGYDMSKYFGKGSASVEQMVDRYRQEVNPEVKVYSVNLAGYKQAQTEAKKNSYLLSGWSEKIINVMYDLEGSIFPVDTKKDDSLTMQVLRERFQHRPQPTINLN